jgi:hypothetical protein
VIDNPNKCEIEAVNSFFDVKNTVQYARAVYGPTVSVEQTVRQCVEC